MMAKKNSKLSSEYAARITVVGVGGGGGNAISRMCDDFSIKTIDFVAINTDAQDLDYCKARKRIYIGKNLTRGLGTGMNPDLGRQAAEENRSELAETLKGSDLVFITAGLGGGTGSGASPVIAEIAKEAGALTVAVVTKPFAFEGSQRARIAQEALAKLKDKVDTLIAIPNDRIFSIIKKDTPILKAFEYIDDVLRFAVQGVAEVIAMPGIVNVDFADVKAVMQDAGSALVGIGFSAGQDRAVNAVTQAINSPLLDVSIDGAKGVLLAVAGGKDMRMSEINDVAKMVADAVDPGAKIIFGAYNDKNISKGQIKVTLVATGFNGGGMKNLDSSPSNLFTSPAPASVAEERSMAGEEDGVQSKKKATKNAEKIPAKKSDSIWDIPTFLRKKKK